MSRHFAHRIAALGAIAFVACGHDITAPAVTGTYALSRVNAAALPAPVPTDATDGGTTMATSGTLVLTDASSWRTEVAVIVTVGATRTTATDVRSGTYRTSRDSIYFRDSSDGSVIPATITAGTLTARLEHVTFQFERR